MKNQLIVLLITLLTSLLSASAETVTLTPGNGHVCVNKQGSVTFSGNGMTLETVAKREGLRNISGTTYRAAVIYDVSFYKGYLDARGKIFNCTDSPINVTCKFYSGANLIVTCQVYVKPRTFSRMIPDKFSFGDFKYCDKIVCSE